VVFVANTTDCAYVSVLNANSSVRISYVIADARGAFALSCAFTIGDYSPIASGER